MIVVCCVCMCVLFTATKFDFVDQTTKEKWIKGT